MDLDDLGLPKVGLRRGAVCLRRFVDTDRTALVKAAHDPLIERYTLSQRVPTEADRDGWVKQRLGLPPPATVQLAIVEEGQSDLSGGITVHLVRSRNSAEAGYWVVPERRGRGLAPTALSIVADWLFDTVGVERFSLLIDLDNAMSRSVAERCGFVYEGVLRSYQPIRGARPDLQCWSLLPSDPRPWKPD